MSIIFFSIQITDQDLKYFLSRFCLVFSRGVTSPLFTDLCPFDFYHLGHTAHITFYSFGSSGNPKKPLASDCYFSTLFERYNDTQTHTQILIDDKCCQTDKVLLFEVCAPNSNISQFIPSRWTREELYTKTKLVNDEALLWCKISWFRGKIIISAMTCTYLTKVHY